MVTGTPGLSSPFDEESLTKINVDVGSENYVKVGSVLDLVSHYSHAETPHMKMTTFCSFNSLFVRCKKRKKKRKEPIDLASHILLPC